MENNQLHEQVKVVADARQHKAVTDQRVKDSRVAWEKDNQLLLDQQKNQATTLEGCETWLRDLTIEAFNATGNKAPEPGVGIRVKQVLDYDPKDAMTWALGHHLALKLDVSSFEKVVKANPETAPFVSITESTTATIATDLEAALAGG